MATTIETIRLLTVRGREEGLQGLAAAMQRVRDGYAQTAQAGQLLTTTTTQLTDRQISAQRAWDALQKRVDPAYRAVANMTRELRINDQALSQGVIAAQQYEREMRRLQTAVQDVGARGSGDQSFLNGILGVRNIQPGAAKESAAAFETELGRIEQVAAERAKQIGASFHEELNRSFGIGGPKAVDMGATFSALDEETKRLEQLAGVRAQAVGQAFTTSLNERLGIGGRSAVDMGATFSALDAEMKRLEQLAELRGRAVGEAFQQGINERLGIGAPGATSRGATFSALDAQMQQQEMIAQARAAQFAQSTQAGVAESFGIGATPKSARESAAAFEEVARAEEYARKRALELTGALDPLADAQNRMNMEIAEYRALQAQRLLTDQQVIRLTDMSKRKFEEAERAIKVYGQSAAFSRLQFLNLSYQLNDIISGLAMGQSPFMILTQQGGQVMQVLSTARGGIRGALGELTGMFGRMLTPARLAFAGIAAAAAGAGLAINAAYQEQLRLEGALLGRGRGSGATTMDLRNIGSAAAGPGMSIAQGRDTASTFAATGKIGVDMMLRLTMAAKDYAATTRQDLEPAVQELATAFGGDLLQGADALNAKLGILDDVTRQYIRTLQLQGNRTEAQRVLFDAMRSNIVDSTTRLTLLGRAWEGLGNFASNAWTKIKDAATGIFQIDERVALQTELAEAKAAVLAAQQGGASPFGGGTLEAQAAAARARRGIAPIGLSAEADAAQKARLDIANARLAAAEAAIAKADQVTADLKAKQTVNDASLKVGDVVRQVDEFAAARQKLADELAVLNQTKGNAALREAIADQAALQRSIDRTTDSVQRLIPEQEKKQRLDALNARIAATANPSPQLRAQWEEERTALEQVNERLTDNEVKTNSANQARTKLLEINKQITTQQEATLRGLDREISMQNVVISTIGKTTEEQERAKTTEQLLAQAREEALLQGIKLNDNYAAALRARAAEQARLKALEDQTRLGTDLAFEREQLGRTTNEQEVFSRTRGMDPTSQQTLFLQQQIRINQALKDTSDISKEAFSGIVSDLRAGTSWSEAMANAVTRIQDRLIQMAIDMVWAKAFGMIGGAVTSAFGSPASLGTGGMGVSNTTLAGLFHLGGTVGNGSPATRRLPSDIFINAPRLHGGLRQDEFPAVLQRGETVTARGKSAEPRIEVHIHGGRGDADVQQTRMPDGGFKIDVILKAMEDRMVGDIRNRGRLARTLEEQTNVVRKR